MSESIPKDLNYSKAHAWVRTLEPGIVEIGITDHAQAQLGDIMSTELPLVGGQVQAGVKGAAVESTKAASDVDSPVSGKVTASNAALADNPDLINDDPYGKGWFYRVSVTMKPTGLMSAAEYEKFVAQS